MIINVTLKRSGASSCGTGPAPETPGRKQMPTFALQHLLLLELDVLRVRKEDTVTLLVAKTDVDRWRSLAFCFSNARALMLLPGPRPFAPEPIGIPTADIAQPVLGCFRGPSLNRQPSCGSHRSGPTRHAAMA